MVVATDAFQACAIRKDDNQVVCWGDNSVGQATPPDDLGPVALVDAGNAATCAVRMDRSLRCWGEGNLGNSTVPDDLL